MDRMYQPYMETNSKNNFIVMVGDLLAHLGDGGSMQ